jgi:hypothetical protein
MSAIIAPQPDRDPAQAAPTGDRRGRSVLWVLRGYGPDRQSDHGAEDDQGQDDVHCDDCGQIELPVR